MIHTAELYTPLSPEEFKTLITHTESRKERNKETLREETHIRSLAKYGITDIHPKKAFKGETVFYSCTIKINLQRIVNNGQKTTQTYIDENKFNTLADNFAKFIKDTLPLRTNINSWGLIRLDYNIDIRLTPAEVEHYIILLQRGNKHHSWHLHEFLEEKKARKATKHGNRKKTHPHGSVLFDNKQYSVNIYDKYFERLKEKETRNTITDEELEASKGILRIEVQTKRNKLTSIKNLLLKDTYFEGKPIEYFAKYDIAVPFLVKVITDICGEADYCTMKEAKKRIKRGIKGIKTKDTLIKFLELVTHTKSLWRAKKLYNERLSINTVLKHLNALDINPVTIPKSFGINNLDNLKHKIIVEAYEQRYNNA